MLHHLGRLALHPGAKAQWMDLPFLPHGLTPSPHDDRLMVLFEKHGPGACVVDLQEGTTVHTLTAGSGRQFYGHGAFSRDGSLLFCTETDLSDGNRGVIAVRDGRDFGDLGEFPSYGIAPHDCVLTSGGDVLVVANGGSPVDGDGPAPNISFVDVDSRVLLDSVSPSDPRINTGHIALGPDDELAIVSAPRGGLSPTTVRGGVSLRGRDGPLQTLREPSDVVDGLLGETLSVAIHEATRCVAATTPLAHSLTFWDLDSGELRGRLRVPEPRGVAVSLDGGAFIVNFGSPPRMARIDATTLRPLGSPQERGGIVSLCTGSHILIADKPGWSMRQESAEPSAGPS